MDVMTSGVADNLFISVADLAGQMTSLAAMDSYLANADASKTMTMVFQFNNEMDADFDQYMGVSGSF